MKSSHVKLDVLEVVREGIGIGVKNAASVIAAFVLWILTIWIPYINVGTTIAMSAIPIELSKGKVISPLFIFDGKYRQFMGEYFALIGLMLISIIPALFFMIVPAIIIAIGWMLAVYILIDKGVAPGEALVQSNKATYGNKWQIFFVCLVFGIVATLVQYIVTWIFGDSWFGIVIYLLLAAVINAGSYGCNAVIYRKLVLERETEDNAAEEIVIAEVVEPQA